VRRVFWNNFFDFIYIALGLGLAGTVCSMLYFDRRSPSKGAAPDKVEARGLEVADA
jgi:hypothetical protein